MYRSIPGKLSQALLRFFRRDAAGGIVLFAAVLAAMIWVNSPYGAGYDALWQTCPGPVAGWLHLPHSLHDWINDGLMAVFFFMVGLELKREFLAGALSSPSKALLPAAAALGGMIVPAGIFLCFNYGLPSVRGWGIPMATDIAFALGLLSLAGKRVPSSLKIFLAALAVADDLGAVIVIALFYTVSLSWLPLLLAVLILLLLAAGNRLGIRSIGFYCLPGLLVWYLFLLSGIHATMAGVLVAFTVPFGMPAGKVLQFRLKAEGTNLATAPLYRPLPRPGRSPLEKAETFLHPWVTFGIMPLFALANAGVPLGSDLLSVLSGPVSLGVLLGLVAGKFTGVWGVTWLLVRRSGASLPQGADWGHMAGVALLAGVGFTMSIFIAGLALEDASGLLQAKYGVLLASLCSGIAGVSLLRRSKGRRAKAKG